jgi:hypothetical protein
VGPPPLILRGNLDVNQLIYPFDASLSQPDGKLSWTLKPANEDVSAAEIILGVNRAAMEASAGSLYAGILRFTDSLGQLQVDVPVSAIKESRVGLWFGEASVNQVQHHLLQKVASNDTILEKVLVDEDLDDDQEPEEKEFHRNTTFGSVARPFPLRLILHENSGGDVRLLQRVFVGLRKDGEELSEIVLATEEKYLHPDNLDIARRITAPHLPRTNPVKIWTALGENPSLREGDLEFEIVLPYDNQESNPFLHTYHPDHDNKDAEFKKTLEVGVESYEVRRVISLGVDDWADDFDAVTRGGGQIMGYYDETLTFKARNGKSKTYGVSGHFVLNRIMSLGNLISGPSLNAPIP